MTNNFAALTTLRNDTSHEVFNFILTSIQEHRYYWCFHFQVSTEVPGLASQSSRWTHSKHKPPIPVWRASSRQQSLKGTCTELSVFQNFSVPLFHMLGSTGPFSAKCGGRSESPRVRLRSSAPEPRKKVLSPVVEEPLWSGGLASGVLSAINQNCHWGRGWGAPATF